MPGRHEPGDLERVGVERVRQTVGLGTKRSVAQVCPHPVDLPPDRHGLAALAVQRQRELLGREPFPVHGQHRE